MSDEEARRVYAAARLGQPVALGARPAVLVVDFSCGFTDPACARRLRPVGCRRGDRRAPAPRAGTGRPGHLHDHRLREQPCRRRPLAAEDARPRRPPDRRAVGGDRPAARLPRRRDRRGQEGRLRLLRHEPHCDPRLPGDRHRRAVRCDHERVRASHRDRPDAERVPRPSCPAKAWATGRGRRTTANLFDIQAKYADVIGLEEAVGYLSSLPAHSSRGRNIQ